MYNYKKIAKEINKKMCIFLRNLEKSMTQKIMHVNFRVHLNKKKNSISFIEKKTKIMNLIFRKHRSPTIDKHGFLGKALHYIFYLKVLCI